MRQPNRKTKKNTTKQSSLKAKTKGTSKTIANQKALKRTYSTRSNASNKKGDGANPCISDAKRKRNIKFFK